MGARAPLATSDTFPPAENAGAVVAWEGGVCRCIVRRGFHVVTGRGGYKLRPFGSDPLRRDATPADIGWALRLPRRMPAHDHGRATRYTFAPFLGGNSSHPWEGDPDHGKVSRTEMNSVSLL